MTSEGEARVTAVNGVFAYARSASLGTRMASDAVDGATLLLLLALAYRKLGPSSFNPSLSVLLLALCAALAALAAVRVGTWLCGQVSPGQWLCGLRRINGRLLETPRRNLPESALPLSYLLICGLALAWNTRGLIESNPFFLVAQEWRLPSAAPMSGQWAVTPLYYTIGSWPKEYAGKPILHSLPYLKGPPSRFVGKIIAHWNSPEASLVFEGPKTPPGQEEPAALRRCFERAELYSPRCVSLREQSLGRHIEEMAFELGAVDRWVLRWFSVQNEALSPDERPQGLYLAAANPEREQERFIAINSKGVHQAFILNRPSGGEAAATAHATLLEAIGGLRVLTTLDAGRSWAERELADVNLQEVERPAVEQNDALARVAEVQRLLLSKVSVDPKDFEAYFHLSGTSLLLLKSLAQGKAMQENVMALKPLSQMIQNTYHYGKDVAPRDPRNAQLEDLFLEAKKF